MRRALLILCSVVSFLVLGLTAVLWQRSYRVADGFAWNDGAGRQRELVSYAGAIHVREFTYVPAAGATGTRAAIREDVPFGASWKTRCGGNTKIVWEGAGFAVAAGDTPVIFLGRGYQPNQWHVTASWIPDGTVHTHSTFVSADVVIGTGNVQIRDSTAGNASGKRQMLTAQTVTAQSALLIPGVLDSWQLAVVLPYWFIAVLSGLLPAYCLAKMPGALRRRRRVKRGLCACCGYDLRASTGRCPECGTAIDG